MKKTVALVLAGSVLLTSAFAFTASAAVDVIPPERPAICETRLQAMHERAAGREGLTRREFSGDVSERMHAMRETMIERFGELPEDFNPAEHMQTRGKHRPGNIEGRGAHGAYRPEIAAILERHGHDVEAALDEIIAFFEETLGREIDRDAIAARLERAQRDGEGLRSRLNESDADPMEIRERLRERVERRGFRDCVVNE